MVVDFEPRLATLQGRDLQDSKLVDPVMGVLKRSYENDVVWLGDDHFYQSTMPNTTLIQYLSGEDDIIMAAASYNSDRMLMLGVEPKLQGGKLAQLLLSKALEENPRTWMTASANHDAIPMIALLSKPTFSLKLVESLEEIEALFRNSNNVPDDDVFGGQMVEHVRLARVLGREGFFAFTHTRSVHGPGYLQFAFRHVT